MFYCQYQTDLRFLLEVADLVGLQQSGITIQIKFSCLFGKHSHFMISVGLSKPKPPTRFLSGAGRQSALPAGYLVTKVCVRGWGGDWMILVEKFK